MAKTVARSSCSHKCSCPPSPMLPCEGTCACLHRPWVALEERGIHHCSKQRQSCSFSGGKTFAHPSWLHIAHTLRNRFTMSENSLSQSPEPAGLWLDATRRGLLWALETEEKWKHCPLTSGCGQAEAQPAGYGREPCCGVQVASSDHPGGFSWSRLPTIPAFPDLLIFAFSASNSLHETFSKYLRWLLFPCPHTDLELEGLSQDYTAGKWQGWIYSSALATDIY